MQHKKLLIFVLLLCLSLLSNAALAQEATPETMELVSPIPGGTCTPDVPPSGDPIVIGGSLSLTGPFGPTGNIHRITGELFVNWVNACGGLLGRPVEWLLLDDATNPDQVTANYERLITVDGVDLVIGPYGAANILAGAAPVQRAGKIYVTHTYGTPDIELGAFHFPSWQIGNGDPDTNPWLVGAELTWDAVLSVENPPTNAFYLTNKFPTTVGATQGAIQVGEARGITTLDYIEYDLGTNDFSAIATRIQAADPDFIYVGGIALDAVYLYDAFEALGYDPKGIFVILPSPGPLMGLGAVADGTMSLSIFEENSLLADNPLTQEFITRYRESATAEQLFPIVETQAAASFSAWQILTGAVVATGSLVDADLQTWLSTAEFDVVAGTISFGGFNGYGTDFNRIVQIQGGTRYLVWPPEVAPEGISVMYPLGG